ncbi:MULTISPECIES: DUF2974 domain-containing protein [Bifidobacterium]|uniref:DUF2974 domain-containing protein n=1 Tax=Bifidobacterium TaxID=1678 RepID=UPI001BDC34F5|nr:MULTISPECIES: DUF2974 domain-containing protein [Bifidobacterium]MBT1160352.1 DUF2974 domain-containing protein [Bifidobacterium sp. SO1]MBW3079243.1 DUF2974 domain-containing protein [Bifidobacterium simiiventris]
MGNITDYARTETRGFATRPFCAADALALAILVYDDVPDDVPHLADELHRYGTFRDRLQSFSFRHPITSLHHLNHPPFDGMTIEQADRELHQGQVVSDHDVNAIALVSPQLTHDFYRTCAANPRFSGIVMGAYAAEFSADRQTQFAALTYRLPDGTLVVSYRGTDDSLVGWKEDFNMSFQYPVPAQVSAAQYLRQVAGLWDGPIILTGHSKGGNLAVYAAMNAPDDVRERVVRIYSLDGPGFPADVVHGYEYGTVKDRIVKIVPDSSIIGMILETPEKCTVVKSDVEGVMQHFAFSWQMCGGEFVQVEDLAHSSKLFNESLNRWMAGLSQEQREHAVDALFAVLEASGANNIGGMMAAGAKAIPDMLGAYVGLSPEDRRNITQAMMILLQAALARNTKVSRR